MANAIDVIDRARELVAEIARVEASYGPVALTIVGPAQAGNKDEVEEFTSTVRLNSENAQQASTLAANASDVALRGSSVVDRVIDTMTKIGNSSSKISDITGIIRVPALT